ncbi:hypothetical protein ACFZBE_18190 [Streptomyces sp. NPDC008061]|jgi:hypothetical protein|uniref:hypothetical protein n=1 Tax=Streptomyces sp. NPDC008061 TaxID=3364805 RepID=UPI0036E159F4
MTSVFITKRGDRYHSREDCGSVIGAQRTAVTMGWTVHPVEEVNLTEAEERGKGKPCPLCAAS